MEHKGAEREWRHQADPKGSDAHSSYGIFLKTVRKDYAVMEREYKLSIESDPNDPDARSNLAGLPP